MIRDVLIAIFRLSSEKMFMKRNANFKKQQCGMQYFVVNLFNK